METTNIKLKTVITVCVWVFLLEWIGRMLSGSGREFDLMMLGAIRLTEAASIIILVRQLEFSATPIGFPVNQFGLGFKKGMIWSVGFGCASGIVFWALSFWGQHPLQMIQVQFPPGAFATGLFFLVGGVISPIAEEVVFRGVIYSFFREWGIAPALLISSFLFVSLHSTGAALPVPQIVGAFLFAIAFEVEKNLMVPITVHILGNLSIFSLSLLTTI